MSTLQSEVTLVPLEFPLIPKNPTRADNVKLKSRVLRGLARVAQSDGRKGLVFSTLSAFVLSLVGAIHEHPTRYGLGGPGCTPAQA